MTDWRAEAEKVVAAVYGVGILGAHDILAFAARYAEEKVRETLRSHPVLRDRQTLADYGSDVLAWMDHQAAIRARQEG